MTRFFEFSVSPYFNKHKGVKHLIAYLNQKYPDFNAKFLNREILLKHFREFPEFDQQKLALIFTYSLKLLEKFLAIEKFEEGVVSFQNLLLLKNLRSQKQPLYYEKILRKNPLERSKLGTAQNQINWLYQQEINEFYNQFRSPENHHYFIQKHRSLDEFFLSEKLKDACEMQLRMRIFNVPDELNFIENCCLEIESNPNLHLENALISIYYNIYKLLKVKSLEQYQSTLKIIQENEYKLVNAELENIYNYLQNYCIQRSNIGETGFKNRLFDIYKAQLQKGLLFTDNQLPEEHYKNIVTVGLFLKRNDWVLTFIQEYKLKLSPTIRENAFTYNLAHYYFSNAQFDEVLKLLARVEYTEVRYNLGAKFLLLKSYYETEEEAAFLALCTSFGQYIRRNRQMDETRKVGYLHFIKYAKKAFRLASEKPFLKKEKIKREQKKLRLEIENEKILFNRNWILGKISEL